MVYEYTHRVSFFEIGAYLHRYIDDHATAATSNAPINWSIEAHARLLLMNDHSMAGTLRRTLARSLPPAHAEYLCDTVHDLMLMELRPFLGMDDDTSVTEIHVKPNYDVTITVIEVDGANAMAS